MFCTLFAVNTIAFSTGISATVSPTVSGTNRDLRAISSTRIALVEMCTLRCFCMSFWSSECTICVHVLLCIWACTWRSYLHWNWRSSCVDSRFYHYVFIVGCCAASSNLNAISIFSHPAFLFKSDYLRFDPSFHDSSNSFWRVIGLRCSVNVIGDFETSVLQWVRWQRVVQRSHFGDTLHEVCSPHTSNCTRIVKLALAFILILVSQFTACLIGKLSKHVPNWWKQCNMFLCSSFVREQSFGINRLKLFQDVVDHVCTSAVGHEPLVVEISLRVVWWNFHDMFGLLAHDRLFHLFRLAWFAKCC